MIEEKWWIINDGFLYFELVVLYNEPALCAQYSSAQFGQSSNHMLIMQFYQGMDLGFHKGEVFTGAYWRLRKATTD